MTIDNDALYKELSNLKVLDQALLDDAWDESKESGISLGKILLARDIVSDENLGLMIADLLSVLAS